MSTTTFARPSTRLSGNGGEPVLNHYFHKADMTRSIVTGESILALCGNIGPVYGQGGGQTTKRSRGVIHVCEDCKRIYQGLGSGLI